MDYLREAAALLQKASASNELQNAPYEQTLMQGRERIAMKYAVLGAIERGFLPEELAKALLTDGE